MTCLDTTVLIDLLRSRRNLHRQAADQRINELLQADEALFTTRINFGELMVGAHLAANPIAERPQAELVLRPMVILELDEKSALRFAEIKANCQRKGRPVGDADLLIATIAQTNGCSLLTRNPKHFRDVPGPWHRALLKVFCPQLPLGDSLAFLITDCVLLMLKFTHEQRGDLS
jgi:tRNA(fMet)-specific endonuclease VapC